MNDISKLKTQASEATSKLDSVLDFAVIGAGIAGLTAASEIRALGYTLAVFEKARGTGGRLSSKRVANERGDAMAFDLGCATISGKSEAFSLQLEKWHLNGVIAPWWKDDQDQTHYVAVSRNSALTRHLSENLECHFSTQISSLQRINNVWHLCVTDEGGETVLAKARNVILATPPAQAYDLLPMDSRFKKELSNIQVDAQWVMGLQVDNALLGLPAIQYPQSGCIFSISQESRKPGRRNNTKYNKEDESNAHSTAHSTILQIQASSRWTRNHLESTKEQVSSALIEELEDHFKQPLNIVNSYVHRWLYSCVTQGIETKEGYLWSEEGLGLIGDYLNDDFDGVESAWLSGKHLAERITLA